MNHAANGQTVLVTGASGFIATHCVQQLLEQGFSVRGTLRDMVRAEQLRQVFAETAHRPEQLQFVRADLMSDDGWDAAAEGCDYVLHIAAPVLAEEPEDENELIAPTRDGTLRVLRAAAAAGVRRTVMTSTTDAVVKGHDDDDKVFDEGDWSNLDADIGSYARAKTLAERAAWEFVNGNGDGGNMELVTILPSMVQGPLLDGSDLAPSTAVVQMIMSGAFPAWGNFYWQLVDVRDVAAAHLTAMTDPDTAGNRYCCAAEGCWLPEMAAILKRQFGAQGYNISDRRMPDFIVRLIARFNPVAGRFMDRLNREERISNAKARDELNWQPRGAAEMLRDTGASMIEHGFV